MAVSANVEDAHCSRLQRILGVFPIVLAAQRSALTCIMWRDVHTTWLTVSWSSGQLLRSLRGVRIPKVFSTAALSTVPFENFSAKDFFSWKFVGSDTLCCIFDKVSPGGEGAKRYVPCRQQFDDGKNLGRSTSVCGRVLSPHMSGGKRWLSCRQPACL